MLKFVGENFWVKIHLVKISTINYSPKYIFFISLSHSGISSKYKLIFIDLFQNHFVGNKIYFKHFISKVKYISDLLAIISTTLQTGYINIEHKNKVDIMTQILKTKVKSEYKLNAYINM